METVMESQATEATDVNIPKPSDVSVDSGYETATMNTSIETSDNSPPEESTSVAEKEGDPSPKGDAVNDASEDDYVKSLVKRLEQVENELKELRSGDAHPKSDADEEPKQSAEREAKISRMTYKEFRKIKPSMDQPEDVAAIVVCYNDADMHDTTKQAKHPESEKNELRVPRQDSTPTHIAVNSKVLADVIKPEVEFQLLDNQTIFIAPFKGIVTYESAIREAFKRRTAECESEEAGIDQKSIDPASADNNDESETQPRDVDLSSNPLDKPEKDDTNKSDQNDECDNNKPEPAKTAPQTSFEQSCIERDLLGCLIEVMDTDLRSIFELRRRLQGGNKDQGGIAYKDLWHLYKPGDIVVSNPAVLPGPQQAYCVLHVTGGRDSHEDLYPTAHNPESTTVWSITGEMLTVSAGVTPFVIDCVYIDYDGAKYGPRTKSVALQDYNGLKAIKSLELFPIRFNHEAPGDYASLVKRGKKYASLRGGVSKLYDGLTLEEKLEKTQYDAAIELLRKKEVNSEIVLDQKAGIQYCEGEPRYDMKFGGGIIDKATVMKATEIALTPCGVTDCHKCTDIHVDQELDTTARLSFIRSTELLRYATKDELTDDHYALLIPRMYGYALQERRWHTFNVEHVLDHAVDSSKLQNSNKSFDDLVLPLAHKTLLRALISNQTRQFSTCINDPNSRYFGHVWPLFPITCGDLGVDANTVELRLEEYFRLASQWGCVLLLDEADVFLAKRSEDQLKRNALVSVFLRVLEYYSGVLMLTTNRVGSFDEAFRSRIHVSLYYPKLGKDETFEIWEMNLRRIKEAKDVDIEIDEAGIKKFYKRHWKANEKKASRRWNGRQIKNAFQTALALANWDFRNDTDSKLSRPKLEASHFKQVAKTSNHFDDYLAEIFREGEDEYADMFAKIAKRENLRNDTDRGHRASKPSRRRNRSEDSSSDSASSDSDHTKRKHSKREKEKKARSKAKKSEVSDSTSDELLSDSDDKTGSSDTESEKSRKKRKAPKKETKKSKGKSKKESRAESGQEDDSGSG
ncbi:unnamed protein product [Alternaria alternata]